MEELGIRVVAARDTETACLMQLHPQDTGGSFLEIDWHVGADDLILTLAAMRPDIVGH